MVKVYGSDIINYFKTEKYIQLAQLIGEARTKANNNTRK